MGTRVSFAVALAVIGAGWFAQVATAGQVSDVGSAVTMRIKDDALSGQVTSAEAGCQANRTVVIIIVRRGHDGTLAKAGTDAAGRWSVKAGSVKDGTKMRAEVRNGFTPEFNCLKATSPVRTYREPTRKR